MRALFYIQLFFTLIFAGQNSFATTDAAAPLLHMPSSGAKVDQASGGHTAVFEVMVPDMEEESHNGSQLKDTLDKAFAIKNLPSGLRLSVVTVNSIEALQAAPLHFAIVARIPSSPLYLTNRVLRL